MMPYQKEHLAFFGDVVAVSDVSVNSKGGSLNATLKKGIREKLGKTGKHLKAAALEFSNNQAVVLLIGDPDTEGAHSIHVSRISKNRFEIELDEGEHEEMNDITAAFLTLKLEQFKQNKLNLTAAVTAEGWQADIDGKFKAATGQFTPSEAK